MQPMIYTRWPGLTLPRAPLGHFPTPLRRLPLPDGPPLWVKDEGAVGEAYGGNKVRKLEHLLGLAQQQGATCVRTLGAVGSHHVLATALHGRELGMKVHPILFPQPATPHARKNARLTASLCPVRTVLRSVTCVPVGLWQSRRHLSGQSWCAVPGGGSNPVGCAGWVSAGLELAAQLEEEGIEPPDRIYAALGSTGTVAGLLLGLRLAGLSSELVAVRVVDRVVSNGWAVKRLARATARLLEQHGAKVPPVPLTGLRVVHHWFAGGYGRADDRVHRAVARGHELGLPLEPTYTGKAFGACLEERQQGKSAVFVSTVNRVDLAPILEGVPEEVPPDLAPLLR